MKLKFYDKNWSSSSEKDAGSIALLAEDKGVVPLRQYLVSFAANLRQGDACTKDYGSVSGTSKKPYRQKGTGLARHGTKRSPIWVGGAVVFGPKPRDYSQKINKKIKTIALGKALSEKISADKFAVISEFFADKPKTKNAAKLINSVVSDKNVLLISDTFSDKFILSVRNLPNVYLIDVMSVNAYDVVRYENIIVSESALDTLLKRAGLISKE